MLYKVGRIVEREVLPCVHATNAFRPDVPYSPCTLACSCYPSLYILRTSGCLLARLHPCSLPARCLPRVHVVSILLPASSSHGRFM